VNLDRPYAELGRWIAASSRLEATIGLVVATLLNTPEPYVGEMMTFISPNPNGLIDIALALADPEERRSLTDPLARARRWYELRDLYLHTSWNPSLSSAAELVGSRLSIPTDRRLLAGTLETVPWQTFHNEAIEIDALTAELHAIGERLAAARGRFLATP
jgi:hypothetical protein